MYPRARAPSLGSLAALAGGLALLILAGDEGSGEPRARSAPVGGGRPSVVARVKRVIDGDTIEVRIGPREETVRYIGVDTPESAIPGEPPECFGRLAAWRNRRLLRGGRVRLVLGAERRDDYGRLLAYVHRGERLVNAALVRTGHARTLAIEPNTRLADRFASLERRAARAGRGIWGEC